MRGAKGAGGQAVLPPYVPGGGTPSPTGLWQNSRFLRAVELALWVKCFPLPLLPLLLLKDRVL